MVDLPPAADVDWFAKRHADWVKAWTESAGAGARVSDVMEGEVILLNPRTRSGAEWEAWYFGNALPGAYRFRSFEELFRVRFLERESV